MSDTICGSVVASRRGLLAFLWSIVSFLTLVAFVIALSFALTAKNIEQDYYNDDGDQNKEDEEMDPEVAVTSRAMAFAALWTAVLAALLSLFGTVILGFQSPTGQYYACCSANVHRTTQLGLGSFIGALIMFANLTLVCSVLFGEFQIRDYQREGEEREQYQENAMDRAVDRSSMAFSIMCIFLTVLYAGFAILTYAFANSVVEENAADYQDDMRSHALSSSTRKPSFLQNGYIGDRFDVRSNPGTFVAPPPVADGTMA